MTYLIAVFAAIGILTVVVFAVVVIGAIVACIADKCQAKRLSGFDAGIKHKLSQLHNDAWWFSESPSTCNLLLNLAKNEGVAEAREIWRNERELEAKEAAGLPT